MTKVKVGILGAGYAAGLHAGILQKDNRVEVIGIADLFLERAKDLAATLGEGVKSVESIEELFELGVNTVYITTPNTMHVEPVLKCLENNVNVFCEKPMATNMQDAEKILEASKKSKSVYNLGMNRRYAYVHKEIKEKIDSKEFSPSLAHIKLNRGELLHPVWTANPEITGGFLYETTIHQIDLMTYLFGEVSSVKCEARKNISESQYDNFAILFTFKSGMIATMVSSAHSGWSFPFESVEVYGKYSTISTEEIETIRYSEGLESSTIIKDYSKVSFEEKCGYVEENKLFIDSIIKGSNPPVDASQAYNLTRLIESIYQSASTGETVIFN